VGTNDSFCVYVHCQQKVVFLNSWHSVKTLALILALAMFPFVHIGEVYR
jgi:hypothetical protein